MVTGNQKPKLIKCERCGKLVLRLRAVFGLCDDCADKEISEKLAIKRRKYGL